MDAVDHSGGAIMVKKLDTTSKKKQKGPVLNGFQLFDMDQLNEINKKEEALFGGKKAEQNSIAIARLRQEAIAAPMEWAKIIEKDERG